MPSINLRELRNTRQLRMWLQAGHAVELRERTRVLARIIPAAPPGPVPDYLARAKAATGGRRVAGSKLLLTERRRARY
jgi:antitoxin (DNA-binding transcriptional repressor) of toxin-antitoxin stability system